jgi:hypothetical protein
METQRVRNRPFVWAGATAVATSMLAGCGGQSPAAVDVDASPSTTASTPSQPVAPTDPPSAKALESPATDAAAMTFVSGGVPLDTAGLAQGQAPGLTYLDGTTLIRASGSTLGLPKPGLSAFGLVGNGLVGIVSGTSDVVVMDGAGDVVRREPMGGSRLATSPDGSIVGWLGDDGAPRVVEGGGSRTWDLPVIEHGAEIAAVLGAGTCKDGVDGNGCAIFANAPDGSGAFVSASHGFVDSAGTALRIADASSNGRVTGLVSATDHGSCSGLWQSSGRLGWTTCDLTLGAFSPDETRVLAGGNRPGSPGQSELAFLDDAGQVLAHFGPSGEATIFQADWEDDDHALAVVHDGQQWSVVRLGVDGSMEYAVAPRPGREGAQAFILPTR